MYSLLTSTTVNGRKYTVTNKGDYRMVLDCMAALRDEEMSEDYRILASLIIFYNEFNSPDDVANNQNDLSELITFMYKFFNGGEEEPIGAKTNYSLVDWEQDSNMIVSAVNKVAGKEIRALEYMHWWTFLSYYMAIGESTFSTVVSIRNKLMKHEKLEKWEQKFKRDSPHYFNWKHNSVEEREAENYIRELWNKGDK